MTFSFSFGALAECKPALKVHTSTYCIRVCSFQVLDDTDHRNNITHAYSKSCLHYKVYYSS